MPVRSRRALLELLGAGTATLLAGCNTGTRTPTERSTPTDTRTPTATATDSDTGSPTESPAPPDCAAVSRPAAAWPVPRRSPARDGYTVAPGGFEAAPALAWKAEPMAPEDGHARPSYGRPVVAGSGLFLTNYLERGPERAVYGHVHALDAGDGERRWASGRLRSPTGPVAWGDRVVVVAENEDLEAMVVALDPADGSRRWTRQFGARDSGFVPAGDHLYLAFEEDSDRGTLRALDDDGSPVWSRVGAFDDHVNEGPAVGTDAVYVATRDGRLHALARDDGATAWTYQFSHATESRPYVTDLVATTCGVVTVVEGTVKAVGDGGRLRWELEGDSGSLASDGETVYVVDGRGGRTLRALDVATGEELWTVEGSVDRFGAAVVAGDTLYVHYEESVVALDRADGSERWRIDGALEDLALADGTLYGLDAETLVAMR